MDKLESLKRSLEELKQLYKARKIVMAKPAPAAVEPSSPPSQAQSLATDKSYMQAKEASLASRQQQNYPGEQPEKPREMRSFGGNIFPISLAHDVVNMPLNDGQIYAANFIAAHPKLDTQAKREINLKIRAARSPKDLINVINNHLDISSKAEDGQECVEIAKNGQWSIKKMNGDMVGQAPTDVNVC